MKESHRGITPKIYKQKNACEFCSKVFDTTNSFYQHRKLSHKKELNSRRIFKCFGCEKSFEALKNLKKHISHTHDNNT